MNRMAWVLMALVCLQVACSGDGADHALAAGTNGTLSVNQVPAGSVAIEVDVNHAPVFDSFEVTPAPSFITRCSPATLRATASDRDGDALDYRWSSQGAAPVQLFPLDRHETRLLANPGDHQVRVTASDGQGGLTDLDIPIHVEPCPN